MTGNGYGVSTLGRTTTGSIAGSKVKNSTKRSRISLTKQKRSGIRRSQLMMISGKSRRQEPSVKTAGLSQLLISAYQKMIEAFIPALVAVATGVAVLFNKVNHRVTQLDTRVDRLELKLVESFTTKADFATAKAKDEDKIEWCELNKIDIIVLKYSDTDETWRDQIENGE